jgi:integrase/recombinase XerD
MSWKITPITHHKEERLKVEFENIPALNQKIRNMRGALWSSTLRSWHVPDTPESRTQLNYFDSRLIVSEADNQLQTSLPLAVSQAHIEVALKEFEYFMQSKRYRTNTIKTYKEALNSFLKFWYHKKVEEISTHDLVVYNNEYIIKNKYSASFQNQVVNAIKLYFGELKNCTMDIGAIHRPKREKKNPNVLNKEEVKQLITKCKNIKHRAMLSVTYACGLRCGEVLNLKLTDIDSVRMVLYVKDGKGAKDRMLPISEKLVNELRAYYLTYKPMTYLFEGMKKGNKYDERSFQLVLKQAIKHAGIKKPVTIHWLRHSYATHLLDSGTDLRFIQELLGHRSSRTTEIYTHVSNRELKNIVSPFDTL